MNPAGSIILLAQRLRAWPMLSVCRGGLLVLAVFTVYLPALSAGWFWDDFPMLFGNPLVHDPDGLRRIWFSTEAYDYFPLTYSLLWLQWRLWGAHPAGYHALNLALHAATAVLAWRVLRALHVPGAWWAALLFAVHPLNVSSVAWIAEVKNTLSGALGMAAALAWVHAAATPATGGVRWRWWAAFGLFTAAALSKTSVVMLPPVWLVVAWWRHGRLRTADVVRATPFFAVSLALGLTGVWFQNHRVIGQAVIETGDAATRLAHAARAIWFYAGKLVWPTDLSIIYPRWPAAENAAAFLPLVPLACVAVVAWFYRRSWGRGVLAGTGAFVLLLLPTLGFFRMYYLRYSPVADHWAYLAGIPLLALLTAPLSRRAWLCASVALALGILTFQRAALFQDHETIWSDVLAKNPGAWVAHLQLGAALEHRRRPAEAVTHYRAVLAIDPRVAEAHYALGMAAWRAGWLDEAITRLERAAALKPGFIEAQGNLALALDAAGRAGEAVDLLRRSVAVENPSPILLNNLGWLLLKTGEYDEAIRHLRRAVELAPDYAKARENLATALARSRQGGGNRP